MCFRRHLGNYFMANGWTTPGKHTVIFRIVVTLDLSMVNLALLVLCNSGKISAMLREGNPVETKVEIGG